MSQVFFSLSDEDIGDSFTSAMLGFMFKKVFSYNHTVSHVLEHLQYLGISFVSLSSKA